MYKLIDKKGGEVTVTNQTIFNKISTNNADGFMKGYLNDFNIIKLSSNQVAIDTGMLSIQGYRIYNDSLIVREVNVTPTQAIPFHFIARLEVFTASENNTIEFITRPTETLTQNNIFKNGTGIYEVELAKFNMTENGIEDFIITIKEVFKVNAKSAYEIAYELDPTIGSESDWIASLKGDSGITNAGLSNSYGTSNENGYTQEQINRQTYTRVYKDWNDIGLNQLNATRLDVANAMVNNSQFMFPLTISDTPNIFPVGFPIASSGQVFVRKINTYSVTFEFSSKESNNENFMILYAVIRELDNSYQDSGWREFAQIGGRLIWSGSLSTGSTINIKGISKARQILVQQSGTNIGCTLNHLGSAFRGIGGWITSGEEQQIWMVNCSVNSNDDFTYEKTVNLIHTSGSSHATKTTTQTISSIYIID